MTTERLNAVMPNDKRTIDEELARIRTPHFCGDALHHRLAAEIDCLRKTLSELDDAARDAGVSFRHPARQRAHILLGGEPVR